MERKMPAVRAAKAMTFKPLAMWPRSWRRVDMDVGEDGGETEGGRGVEGSVAANGGFVLTMQR